MATTALPLPSSLAELPPSNSYGSLDRFDDIEVLPTTTDVNTTHSYSKLRNDEVESALSNKYRPPKTSCLKPHQSETLFALCLFILGLGLLIFVGISFWLTESQISPIILLICGLLCFIPGCYYLIEHYCCANSKHRRFQIIDQDETI